MATVPIQGVLDHLRRSALREQGAALTDADLLALYLARRDEAAFEALVLRHGPMVLGVCRRVLANAADAEDAFQATFLVLARKAASVLPRENVAAWLHGVAHNVAVKARAAAASRRDKEREAAEMGRPDEPDDRWADLLPVLDRELRLLPERYRIPIVLCDLEGKSHAEAAREMGWPVGTLSGRLSRGRALLARRMARHGAAPAVAARAISQEAVPGALAASTARAAVAYATGKVLILAKAVALAEGVVKSMFLAKLMSGVAVCLAVVLVGAAVAFGAAKGGETPVGSDRTPPATAEAAQPDPEEDVNCAYVEELRAAVKNPTDGQHVYRLVIDPRFRKALHWAARRGEDALVVELARYYCGPNNPDKGGTALTWAAWLNDAEAVRILLARGATLDAGDDEGRTALHEATRWGATITKLLLDKGADVNARTKTSVTPVMQAAAAEDPDALRLILERGADVNARDDESKTALMHAAENGRLANARALLAGGADVRLKDRKGRTALELVRPSNDWLSGTTTDEFLKRHSDEVEKDAEALRVLLKRAGG